MIGAGPLNAPVRFQRRDPNAADPYGRPVDGWANLFDRFGRLEAKTGGETYQGRIEGRQGYELLVRRDPETNTITPADRFQDLVSLQYLGVKSVAPFPPDPSGYLLLTAEAGGANG